MYKCLAWATLLTETMKFFAFTKAYCKHPQQIKQWINTTFSKHDTVSGLELLD